SQDGAFGAEVTMLTEVRIRRGLWEPVSRLAEDLPPLIGTTRRSPRLLEGPEPAGAPLETILLPSRAGEAAFVARRLREARVLEGRDWAEMAVIVRGHHQLSSLRRSLTAAGVPVKVSGAEVPLREEPVVKALLTCLEVAADPAGPGLGQ